MILEPIAGWNPSLRTATGRALAERLRADPERAHAIAGGLAPDGSGPGWRLSRYVDTLRSPREVVAYQNAFPDLATFLVTLDAGDPGALELALVILAQLDPEATVPIAEQLLPERPWKTLGSALNRALGAASSERSFELLLAHPEVTYLRDGLATNRHPGGVPRAWAAYTAYGDLARPELDPRERVCALPILSYLLRFDLDRAYAEVVRLSDAADSHVVVYAAHRLFEMNTEASIGVLLQRLEETEDGAPLRHAARMGIQALLVKDAAHTIDALGGTERLLAPAGRPRLRALLDHLSYDTFPGGGRPPSSGWLSRDPRFAALCKELKRDPDRELARTAGYLLGALPKDQAPPPRKKKARKKTPDAALIAEMEANRAALEQLHRFLVTSGYHFLDSKRALRKPSAAGKRAIAKLEKAIGALPAALTAFWTVVGSVDLRGQDPGWPRPACLELPDVREDGVIWQTDPLVILPPEAVAEDALEELIEDAPLGLPIAPDAIGKAGYSGGALRIWLPSEADDPAIEGGLKGDTLRAHMKRALSWAGMPGFETIEARPVTWLARARSAS